MGLPLTNMKREGEKVHFELAAGPGLAVFEGVLAKETIRGEFMQAGIKGSFSLVKSTALAPSEPATKRDCGAPAL